jgi:large conductance mechanosensitive channel
VIDLAVAVVIGAAFGAVVTAFVKDLVTPLIAALVRKPDVAGLSFTVNGTVFPYGDFLNALIAFVLVAAVVYYVVVVPMQAISARLLKPAEAAPATTTCPECLSEIPVGARRCRACGTAQV